MWEEGLGTVLLGLEEQAIGSSSWNGERGQLAPYTELEARLLVVGFSLSWEAMGTGVGVAGRGASPSCPRSGRVWLPAGVTSRLQFRRTSFGGNRQMHLALVRDRPRGGV